MFPYFTRRRSSQMCTLPHKAWTTYASCMPRYFFYVSSAIYYPSPHFVQILGSSVLLVFTTIREQNIIDDEKIRVDTHTIRKTVLCIVRRKGSQGIIY